MKYNIQKYNDEEYTLNEGSNWSHLIPTDEEENYEEL